MKNKRKKDKLLRQIKHAARRAEERLGIEFTQQMREKLVADIKHNRCHCLYRQSHRVSVFRTTIADKPMDVVYDKMRHTVVTFLYPEVEAVYEIIRKEGKTRAEAVTSISPASPKAVTLVEFVQATQGKREDNPPGPQATA